MYVVSFVSFRVTYLKDTTSATYHLETNLETTPTYISTLQKTMSSSKPNWCQFQQICLKTQHGTTKQAFKMTQTRTMEVATVQTEKKKSKNNNDLVGSASE